VNAQKGATDIVCEVVFDDLDITILTIYLIIKMYCVKYPHVYEKCILVTVNKP